MELQANKEIRKLNIGESFDNYTIVKYDDPNIEDLMKFRYLCQCSRCGKSYWALKTNIMQGRSSSCGCKGVASAKALRKLNEYKVLGDGTVQVEFSNRSGKYFYIDQEDVEKIRRIPYVGL